MRDGFIFYESFRDAIKGLPSDSQLVIYNAMADYALYDIEPDFGDDGVALGFFKLIRPQLDANIRKRKNGALGGRPPLYETEDEPKANLDETTDKPNDNRSETEDEPKANVKANAKGKAKGNAKAKNATALSPLELVDPRLADSIREFKKFRVTLKKPMTDRAVSMLVTRLEKLAPGNVEMQIAIIEKSIYKGWQDVYELKDDEASNQRGSPPDRYANLRNLYEEVKGT